MIRCIAIDDEPLALAQITGYIEKTSFLELVAACHDALQAMDIIAKGGIDLMFVDINMPDLSGMEFVKSLTEKPLIVFTTAYSEYALEGFRVDALDYLLKPISYTEFLKSANKALRQHEIIKGKGAGAASQNIFIKADYKMVQIDLNTITYVESQNEYIRIFTENEKPVMTLLSMKAIEERLPPGKFMRVHRSYIVNLQKITMISKGSIMIGKIHIPVGNQYRENFCNYVDKNSLIRE
ncbi:MAG: LytR/AlgR family response regulator transcription factor [Mangrovibacterium sp.]